MEVLKNHKLVHFIKTKHQCMPYKELVKVTINIPLCMVKTTDSLARFKENNVLPRHSLIYYKIFYYSLVIFTNNQLTLADFLNEYSGLLHITSSFNTFAYYIVKLPMSQYIWFITLLNYHMRSTFHQCLLLNSLHKFFAWNFWDLLAEFTKFLTTLLGEK